MKRGISAILTAVAATSACAQQTSVVNSSHNLSASAPGAVRAVVEDQVCVFCHAPHNATPVRPLWNRLTPADAYSIYQSRSLDALPGQPTGASKMCLSCHDGTIALGNVVSRDTPILMSGGVTTMPQGRGHLGTDLRDDHPISFRFDPALAARDLKLRSPNTLPEQIRLDVNAELQCTSCHDAHNNAFGKFLVMPNTSSQMCNSCHQMGTTAVNAHTNCSACHQPHSAPSGPYLLKGATIAATCTSCHNGSVPGAPNIHADLKKISAHDTGSPMDPPAPASTHVNCSDCHEPHTMGHGASPAPTIHPNFGRQSGVSASGSPLAVASNEFEVCFKCHAENGTQQPVIARLLVQNNTRLEFNPSSPSYHPVEAPGRNSDVPSLRPGLTTSTVIGCSSCHNSDAGRTAGGTGPDGVHGSNVVPLLSARYETADFTSESATAYALCYRCHDRANILSDRSFKEHRKHIVEQRTPCSACHDSHGIASTQGNATNNSNLINFATAIVRPSRANGRLEFRDLGTFRGQCSLTCHGEDHAAKGY